MTFLALAVRFRKFSGAAAEVVADEFMQTLFEQFQFVNENRAIVEHSKNHGELPLQDEDGPGRRLVHEDGLP
jgi:hypothetical protein